MENMGKLSEYSDTKQALYPINYRFVYFNKYDHEYLNLN